MSERYKTATVRDTISRMQNARTVAGADTVASAMSVREEW